MSSASQVDPSSLAFKGADESRFECMQMVILHNHEKQAAFMEKKKQTSKPLGESNTYELWMNRSYIFLV